MSDKSKITLKWPLIDGILQKSDTTYLGPTNNRAMYIHEVYKRPDGQNTEVTKGIYSDGYRFIDMLTGNDQFIQGYRPDGSINYTVTSDDIKQDQKGPRQYNKSIPKGYTGMEIRRALNLLNPFTWPSRIAATLPKNAPEGTKFPAVVVDKKSQTLRYYDKNGKQQLSSIVSTGANKGDITAKAESKTPEGHFTVGSKVDNVKKGVFGDNLFMGLSGTSNSGFKLNGRGFGIHGDANRPFQLGRCDSHGCVRVEHKNLDDLYNLVQPGTNVYIRKKGGTMKLIPRGKFGLGFFNRKEKTPRDAWDQQAQTVTIGGKTYSTANRDQVIALQNYLISQGHNLGVKQGTGYFGKNTKAALNKHFSSSTPVIDNPTYIAQEAIAVAKAPDAGLMFNATSIGVPNAYNMSTNAELETAIDTQEKKNEIARQANAEQQNKQQAYEDLWARRNYKAITGEDWHAGIDLSNYTMDAIRKLQEEIGTTVDGKWGVKSQQAYDLHQKKQNPEPQPSTQVSTQDVSTTTDPTQQINYWELVKDNPEFAQWLYTSGGQGSSRRLANLINVGGNYVMGMFNPDGKTVFNLGQGLQRQAVAAALYGQQHGITGITDRAHSALGGLNGKHSGDEFRENTNAGGYLSQAMSSPYHNVYGQSADARFTERGFESVGDGYTYNNVWHGKNSKGIDKVVTVMGDGEGTASLGESYQAYKSSRESGNSIKAAMETAATVRGVNTSRHNDVSFVPQNTLEEWAKEYYLANNSQKSVVKSSFGGMLKHITGY